MVTTQRNGIYVETDKSEEDDVTWSAPPSNFDAWGVGIDGNVESIDMLATVTKV